MASKVTPIHTFEFTKRKRWSETLFSELSETLVFVLSPTCKVLYCGSAIVELLGWKEDQLVDTDLTLFVNDEDRENFRWSFTESLRSGQDLLTYARFKSEQPPSLDASGQMGQLFEVKGHPHYEQGIPAPQCFFLTAMPYPSKNIAMLNTFLELKVENESLSQRITDLKKSIDTSSHSRENYSSPPLFSTSSQPQLLNHAPVIPNYPSPYPRSEPGQPFYPISNPSGSSTLDPHKPSLSRVAESAVPTVNNLGPLGMVGDDEGEDSAFRKKKAKKALMNEEQRVCVTCGRTDSPEWRKGPLGPKTLCNACGLRWAKRARKTDSEDSPALGSDGKGQDGDASPGPGKASMGHSSGTQLPF